MAAGAPAPGFRFLTEADLAKIRAAVRQSPPLTPEQRRRLRPILAGTLKPREQPQAA